jgi:hypothetical protein
MKSYAFEKNYTAECEFITLMRKRIEGKITPTKRAPSRYALEMFGGTLKIEEFRNGVYSLVTVNIPGEVFQQQTIIKEEKPIADGSGLKLKREKPLERAKGKLETSLNVIRKCQRASGAV